MIVRATRSRAVSSRQPAYPPHRLRAAAPPLRSEAAARHNQARASRRRTRTCHQRRNGRAGCSLVGSPPRIRRQRTQEGSGRSRRPDRRRGRSSAWGKCAASSQTLRSPLDSGSGLRDIGPALAPRRSLPEGSGGANNRHRRSPRSMRTGPKAGMCRAGRTRSGRCPDHTTRHASPRRTRTCHRLGSRRAQSSHAGTRAPHSRCRASQSRIGSLPPLRTRHGQSSCSGTVEARRSRTRRPPSQVCRCTCAVARRTSHAGVHCTRGLQRSRMRAARTAVRPTPPHIGTHPYAGHTAHERSSWLSRFAPHNRGRPMATRSCICPCAHRMRRG